MKLVTAEQHTPEWYAARLGVPTASAASRMVTSKGEPSKSLEGYAEELAAEIFAGKPLDDWQGNAYTERGIELEAEARAWLSFERDVEIQEMGFCLDDNERHGCSVDGWIESEKAVVELKCLPKQHMKAILRWHTKQVPPSDYLPQVHHQMLAMDASYCLLTYYHPDLPKAVIRIERNHVMDAKLITQIERCIQHRDETLALLREMAA